MTDDLGRESVSRDVARALLSEHREAMTRKARLQQDIERRAIAADERFRASLPPGVPAGAVPEGVPAGVMMMLSDPMDQGSRRQTVLEHALEHPAGAVVYTPIGEAS